MQNNLVRRSCKIFCSSCHSGLEGEVAWFAVKKFQRVSQENLPIMRLVKIMDPYHWTFQEPARCNIVCCGSARPHPASWQETWTKIAVFKLWSVHPQGSADYFQEKWMPGLHRGWLFCWQKWWGSQVKKELKVMIFFFFKVPFSYTSMSLGLPMFWKAKVIPSYTSIATIPSCNSFER